ncbi:CAP domain-containing protein [Fictibacillus sp. Mic-4]|uniref:CAP domain-containing protein n=1 Tax=Fictibacillus sp. Mic-4 TaxID=3132826 RepID=UPI003CE98755
MKSILLATMLLTPCGHAVNHADANQAKPDVQHVQNKETKNYGFHWNNDIESKVNFIDKKQPAQPKVAAEPEQKQEPVKQQQAPQTETKQQAPDKQPSANVNETIGNQVISLVNKERSKQGLAPLKDNASLDKTATLKAEDMRDKNYFDHNSPTYGDPFQMMKQFGINYSRAAENIAAGQKDAQDVMDSWMKSPGHRANILDPNLKEIGIGYATGGSYGTYWVQQFITK